MKRCFFIGHRDAPDNIFRAICGVVEHHITNYGVTDFLVGHYGYFDQMAAKAVVAAKGKYSDITLTLLLPYYSPTLSFESELRFDRTLYPDVMDGVPHRAAIIRANMYAIDHSDHLIAYARYAASNTRKLYEYAQRRAKKGLLHITNLADHAV